MTIDFLIFLAGLLAFLGLHSTRIFAENWRRQTIAHHGEKTWKAIYSVLSIAAFIAMIWGYANSHNDASYLWSPPSVGRSLIPWLMLLSFILLVAAHIPGTKIKSILGHPMLAATALWSAAHLMVNGKTTAALLFGGFLLWSLLAFFNSRRRDRLAGKTYVANGWARDVIATIVGIFAWILFARFAHLWLIGVMP